MQHLLDKSILNLVLLIIIITASCFIFVYLNKVKRINALLSPKSSKKVKKDRQKNSFLFSKLKENLHIALLLRNKESLSNTIFNIILLSLFFVFIFFLSIDHLILAITIPTLAYIFISKIVEELIVDFDKVVRDNFTSLANHMVKVFLAQVI